VKVSLLVIDGVLRKHMGGPPVPEGIRLYKSLASTGQVVLIADGQADDKTYEWLELNGCARHAFVWWKPLDHGRVEHVNALRRESYDIDLVVVPDPVSARELIEAGFNTLLFTHAKYAQPGWRPDAGKGIRAWAEITEETAKQAAMKAADERLKDIG